MRLGKAAYDWSTKTNDKGERIFFVPCLAMHAEWLWDSSGHARATPW
jgi:hypothetical protein